MNAPLNINLSTIGSTSQIPLVSREKFAELVGLPVGVIIGFVNKGYLPTVSIGKYSLINLELLRKQCLDREFE